MPRYSHKALHWVHRNRQPLDRACSVGRLAESLLEGHRLSVAQRLADLQRAIAGTTDAEFRAHCSLGSLRGGALTLLVDDPSLAYAMRERWLVPLLEMLKCPGRRLGVSSLRFASGSSHLTLDGSPDTEDNSGSQDVHQGG